MPMRINKIAFLCFSLLVAICGIVILYKGFFGPSETAIIQDKITDSKKTSLIVKSKDDDVVTSECLNDEYTLYKVGDTIEIKYVFVGYFTKSRAETLIEF